MRTLAAENREMTLGEFIAEMEKDWEYGTQSVAELLRGIIPPSDSEKKVDVTFTLSSDQQEAGTRFVFRWYVTGYVPRIENRPRCIEFKSDGFVVSSNTKLV